MAARSGEKTCEQVTQDALNQTGFGIFNLKIFATCALICVNGSLGLGNVGLIIPAAACDFKMSTVAKGYMAMMPVLGMVFGPYCWATLAEMKGRRIGLIISLISHGVGDITASVISNFWGLLVCKFLVGFGFSGQFALLFTYLGEFQPCKVRDRLLAWLELPWVSGLLLTAALGWAIMPLNINYESTTTGFIFKSWSLYLLICGLLSPILALWIVFLPETPKYLAETGQHKKLLELFGDIYHANTGQPKDQYLEIIKKMENPGLNNLIARAQEYSAPTHKSIRQMVSQYMRQTKEIIKPPHLKTTILMSIASYTVTAPYYTLIFWLPEIFLRYSIFEELYPEKTASVCTISNALYAANATQKREPDYSDCTKVLSESVYFHNMILGATSVPVAFWLPLFVDRFGYKIHLVGASLSSALLAFGLLIVETSTQNLIIACLFEALASVSITIVLCTAVELYPTHLRVIASALAAFVGRMGAFVGISMVGYLIDDYCVPLILLIGSHLVVAGITGIFIPIRKTKQEFEKRERLTAKLAESTNSQL
ncbi:synaptic vesicle glycoprotein 2C-like isoform X1 [Diachasmimorpha longicaudata]|uniref:synaptic vesicle glycoprotein 2C-like isoform X1 n=2 Tax=Diachasmimorpha longicaudata TaxID=58733 RepID=UPI0030B8DF4A